MSAFHQTLYLVALHFRTLQGIHTFYKHYSYENAVEMLENYLQRDMKDHAKNFLMMISNHQFDDENGKLVGPGVRLYDYGMSKDEIESRNKKMSKRLEVAMNAAAKLEHVHNKEKTKKSSRLR